MSQSETPESNNEDQSLMVRLQDLLLEQERVRVHDLEYEVSALEKEIEQLNLQLAEAKAGVIPTVTEHMSTITNDAVKSQRDDMIEALYPVVGAAVARSVGEALDDLRRRIDSQLRPNQGGVGQTLLDRIRGVDRTGIALRNALPFEIRQIFLIQHDSGLVLEFINKENDSLADHDLISSMLTAIRSFVSDSFNSDGDDDQLDSIQYGDEHIILESGTAAYIAAVVSGAEPEGFRSLLRTLVNELHIRYKQELVAYDGDETTLPDVKSPIDEFIEKLVATSTDDVASGSAANQILKTVGLVLSIFLLMFCIFYGWLTIRLMPYALNWPPSSNVSVIVEVTRLVFVPTETHMSTSILTSTSTATPISTATSLARSTFTPTPVSTTSVSTLAPTLTPTPLPTATLPLTPIFTSTPALTSMLTPSIIPTATLATLESNQIVLSNPVWTREVPEDDSPQFIVVDAGTEVEVLQTVNEWLEIRWEDAWRGVVTAWIKGRWVNISN